MGCGRAIVCILFPPLSVIDRGCGVLLVVTTLWVVGLHVGGVIAALIVNYMAAQEQQRKVV